MSTPHPLFTPPDPPFGGGAEAWLATLDVHRMRLGTGPVQALLASLGHPERQVPVCHVAGTNGKGSVVALLSHVLTAAGYRTGRLISPHLWDVRERIAVDNRWIAPADLDALVAELRQHLSAHPLPDGDGPTYFEALTVLGFWHLARIQAEMAVVEVGLGGRLDATNVVPTPALTVITGIDWDHMAFLGNSLGAIATEKAGILRAGVPLVLGPTLPEEALAAILQQAEALGVPVTRADGARLRLREASLTGQTFEDTQTGQTLVCPLRGPYQRDNLATALTAVDVLRQSGWTLPSASVAAGVAATRWPGRFQVFPGPRWVVDGSHNPQGFAVLPGALAELAPDGPWAWWVSLRQNRDPAPLIEAMAATPGTQAIYWTPGPTGSAYHDPEVLVAQTRERLGDAVAVQAHVEPVSRAVLTATAATQPGLWQCVTGSLYTAGLLLETLLDAD